MFWFWGDAPRLSVDAQKVIRLLAAGSILKAHRSLGGAKEHRIHPLHGQDIEVSAETMDQLKRGRLIDSNMKFPAAAYLLTPRGRQVAASLVETATLPLGSRGF